MYCSLDVAPTPSQVMCGGKVQRVKVIILEDNNGRVIHG